MWMIIIGLVEKLWSKSTLYVLIGISVVSSIFLGYRAAKETGIAQERAKQDSAVLSSHDEEAKSNAKIDSMSDARVRNELRNRWRQR